MTRAQLDAGDLTYVPPANAHGFTYDSFTFTVSDGEADSEAATVGVDVDAVNDAPTVATPIPDQAAAPGAAFGYTFPAGTFSDVDADDTLTYSATQSDGAELPSWLLFDPSTRAFSGTPPATAAAVVTVKVTAEDGNGGSASDEFRITLSTVVDLSVDTATLSEGASATSVSVTAELSGALRDAATAVTVSVGSGTATAGTDFAAVAAFTVTIAANARSQSGSFSLDPADDRIDEADETVAVTGTATGLTVNGTGITLEDDDAAPVLVLSVERASIDEAGGTASVTVSTGSGSTFPDAQTIALSVGGTATEGTDYTIGTKTLSLPAGSGTSASEIDTTVTAVDDAVVDPGETVLVSGSRGGTAFGSQQTIVIADDDVRGVSLSRDTLTVAEGGTASYTVALDTPPTGSVTVTPASDDTGAATVSGALTFTASNWATPQSVTVTGVEDADAANETVTVAHTVAGADYASVTAGDVAVTVEDDETATTGINLSVDTPTLSEGAAATSVSVTAELNGAPRDAATAVTVSVGSGTATAGTDFATVAAFTVTIAANARSQSGSFSLDPTDDRIDEADETVAVTGTATGLTVNGAEITLEDDDAAPVLVLSVERASIDEAGGTSAVTVSTGSGSTFPDAQTIALSLGGTATEGADYTIGTKTLQLPAGSGTAASEIDTTVTAVDDAVVDPGETVLVSAARGGTAFGSEQTIVIADDDVRGVSLSRDTLTVAEGGTASYTVALDTPPTGSVTVTPASDDTGAATVSGALTFTAANWATPQSVTVTGVEDADAANETVTVAHTVAGADYASVTAGDVAVTVEDDETATTGINLSVDTATLSEGAAATSVSVTAELNGAPRDAATTVTVSVGSGTATAGTDFATVAAFTVTIAANARSQSGSFSLDPTDDRIDEADETVAVTGTATGLTVNGTGITLEDDDAAPVLVLSVERASIDEAGGTSLVTVSTGSGSTFADAQTIALSLAGTATEGTDYTIGTKTLQLPAGSGTSASEIDTTVTAVDDAVVDPGETVLVSAARGGTAFGSQQTIVIADDDVRGVSLSRDTLTVAEGGTASYTVALDTPPTGSVTVTPASDDTGAATVSGALTFTAANWATPQSVTVTGVEDADAANETVTVAHTVAGADYASVTAGDVAVTVEDDETATTGINLSVDTATLSEGAAATSVSVTAELNGAPRDAATTVTVSVGSGTATAGTDFATVAAFTVTIAANARSQSGSFSLDPTDDRIDEADETVAVTGTATGLTVNGTGITLEDDDAAPVLVLSVERASIDEAGGTSAVTVSTGSGSTFPDAQTIALSLGGTATEGTDYTIGTKTLQLPAGSGTAASEIDTTVTAVDDAVVDPGETVLVSAARGGTAFGSQQTIVIADDDVRGVSLSRDTLTVAEGGTASYTVALDTPPTGSVTVTPASDDTGAATVSGALTFTATDWATPQSVTVTGVQDADAANETVTVAHTVAGADYASVTAGDVAVTVEDDETATTAEVSVAPPAAAAGGFLYEGEAGSATDANDDGTGAWTVTRDGPVDAALTVGVNVTETGSGDFVAAADAGDRTVTIAAGETTAQVYAVTDDTVDESHNVVTVTVVPGAGYDVAPAPDDASTVEVRDDDGDLVAVTVDPAAFTVQEGRTTGGRVDAVAAAVDDGTFDDADDLARLFGGTAFGLTATTADGTTTGMIANAPADYAALSAEAFEFDWADFEDADGGLVARLALPAVAVVDEDPPVADPDEEFTIAVAKASAADARIVLGTPATATATIVEGPEEGKLRLCGAGYRCVHEDGTLDVCDADGVCEEQATLAAVPAEGRIEIAHEGVWGTVCDDYWSIDDAAVACRQIFGQAAGAAEALVRAPFGGAARGVKTWLDDVRCNGGEDRLALCEKRPWGRHNCPRRHTEDAGVRCVPEQSAEGDGYVVFRVHGEDHPRRAAVEVAAGDTLSYALRLSREPRDRSQGVVYLARVEPSDAGAAVRRERREMLARRWANLVPMEVTVPGRLAAGTELRVVHEVDRRDRLDPDFHGPELDREYVVTVTVTAPRSGLGDGGARSALFAADGDIALAGGEDASEGRVEVYRDGAWGSVCADGWSLGDAEVACRQAGRGTALQAVQGGDFGSVDGVVAASPGCTGTEARLADCPAGGTGGCGTGLRAGAVCAPEGAEPGVPRLLSAAADGDRVVLAFDRALDAAFAPGPADFEVRSGAADAATRHAVDRVEVVGRRLTLAVSPPLAADAAVRASYLRPARHPLRAAVGHLPAAAFDEVAVANRTPSAAAAGDAESRPGIAERAVAAPGLEAAVRAALRGGTGREALVRLDASRRGIVDLAGIEALAGLEELNLAGNAVEDLAPLAGLARLRVLDLADNRVAELWPLAAADRLERLILAGNRVVEAGPLAGMANLRVLDLADNAIDDAWPLGGLGALEYLSVAGNRIGDPAPLAGLRALVRLDLGGNAVTDVSALAGLDRVVWLRLSGNRIARLDGLGRLTRLRWVLATMNPLATGAALELPAGVRADLGGER